ncbi:DUF4954 family protein [Plebeiibacterium marinum]|uniref:DUF4954 family protein n=1 Tax=Plebeiibacterium marinum TaxID=2992111 RepID=A0AAE3MGT8_9BACT|nr:DUF4954 family protein [Plebeiobacterium marinum]MCW3806762.1 DUF4954 family protein [Plebeiobacterium marinum]
MNFRKLNNSEIQQLENQNCKAVDGWENVFVTNSFVPDNIKHTTFSGENYIGLLNQKLQLGGASDFSGIYNAHLHNCRIGDQVYIKNISNSICNYNIENDCIIQNTNSIQAIGESSFGNGEKITPINEAGGREVHIYNELSVHTAYIMAFYSANPKLTNNIRKLITEYSDKIKSSKGTVKQGTSILNCGTITNVNFGSYCKIEGATYLNEGSINSSKEAPAYVGYNVNASHFILSTSSIVSDGAYLRHCFVGQGVEISNHYTAENSVFFANSQCLQGEACAIFAGPYTVTHHKSTLLIAGYYSFFNAGSGTNQSNHMYKLGPVHQGIIERGGKTGSDSYILWPAKIGAFTMILGRHYSNPDISDLPFSYFIEEDGKSILMPAQNIFNVGITRDVDKWPKRDKRKGSVLYDKIITEALNPYTINKILNAISLLKKLQEKATPERKTIMYNSTQLSLTMVKRGIMLYEQALIKYAGDALVNKLKDSNFIEPANYSGIEEWIDLGGLICKKTDIRSLEDDLSGNKMKIDDLNQLYESLFIKYEANKQAHAFQILNNYFNIDTNLKTELAAFIDKWVENNNKILSAITSDAKKEFNAKTKTGFGHDGGEKEKEDDFYAVRGSFEENDFVVSLTQTFTKANSEANDIKESIL